MTYPTVAVTVALSQLGGAIPDGTIVTATLDKDERYQGFLVASSVSGATVGGSVVLNCFPNNPTTGLGTTGSVYTFSAFIAGLSQWKATAQIPNTACNLSDVAALLPLPSLNQIDVFTATKDASNGFPGLTLLKLNLRNTLGTITSWFTTAATVARTWTMPDKSGTVAMTSDLTPYAPLSGPTFTGLVSFGVPASGIVARIPGASVAANTRNFNFTVADYPGVNLPGDSRSDSVVHLGWNVTSGGTREDVTDASFADIWEGHYLQGGTGTPAFERHWEVVDTGGTRRRPLTGYFPKDGGAGSALQLDVDTVLYADYNSTVLCQMNMLSKTFIFNSGFAINGGLNNSPVAKQINAAGNAWLSLPYINAADSLLLRDIVQINAAGEIYTPGLLNLSDNAHLYGESANTLALRNGTNGQVFALYNSFTNVSNYQCLVLSTTSTSVNLWAASAGTGAANIDIALTPLGTGKVKVSGAIVTAGFATGTVLKTASYTVALTDSRIEGDATAGAVVLTLPALSTVTAGQEYSAIKIDSSANAVTFDANASETINGALTLSTTTQYGLLRIKANAAKTAWYTY